MGPHVTFLHPSMNMEHPLVPRGLPAGRTEPNQSKHQGGPIESGNLPASWFFLSFIYPLSKEALGFSSQCYGRPLRRYGPLSPPWAPEQDPVSKIKKKEEEEEGMGTEGSAVFMF